MHSTSSLEKSRLRSRLSTYRKILRNLQTLARSYNNYRLGPGAAMYEDPVVTSPFESLKRLEKALHTPRDSSRVYIISSVVGVVLIAGLIYFFFFRRKSAKVVETRIISDNVPTAPAPVYAEQFYTQPVYAQHQVYGAPIPATTYAVHGTHYPTRQF
jgi:hypothetical protein